MKISKKELIRDIISFIAVIVLVIVLNNFITNNFSHPYHGALFFSAGRTNGYNFWESTAWSLSGSAIFEYFGETFRPAFNDWIYTGVGGANLGEIIYRLSSGAIWSLNGQL